MKNPKTTISGYLVLTVSILSLVTHWMNGTFGAQDVQAVLGALGGVGLIVASDGGH